MTDTSFRNTPAVVRSADTTPGTQAAAPWAVRAHGIGKQYRRGAVHALNDNFREEIMNALARLVDRRRVGGDRGLFWALKDIDLEVKRGETLGIIGRNGAGKSTLLKILSRITTPTEGTMRYRGRLASLLEVGTGFHRELTGRENIFMNGAILGMRRAEIRRQFDAIVDFAEVDEFLDTPVKFYSSGMYVRLAFAVAAHLEPEILVVDEVLAVGDIAFQKKCIGKMSQVSREGRTVLTVSHNMRVVADLCQRAIWLDRGHLRAEGPVKDVITRYAKEGHLSVATHVGPRIVRNEPDGRKPTIEWVEILDDFGRECTVIESGSFLNLVVGIRKDLPPECYFEWALFTENGTQASSGGTFMPAKPFTLPTPSGAVRARVGPLTLAQGNYALSLRVGVFPGPRLDTWDEVATIMITKCYTDEGGHVFDVRRGIVYIPTVYCDGGDFAAGKET